MWAGMTGLRDRHVLVTGAASGIGEATVERLVREGARVALVDHDAERLATVRGRLEAVGGRVAAFPTDVGDEAAVRAAVEGRRRA
jgi:NADP-dependent 3-hydroxy acid dehydrogenase YdfG